MSAAPDPRFVRDFEKLAKHERTLVDARRARRKVPEGSPTSGLALSGGGIRAAAFGMGVSRALHERKMFDRLDYLSTVSGGGFTGGFISWLRRRDSKVPHQDDALIPTPALHYLRQHADYLDPGGEGKVLRSMPAREGEPNTVESAPTKSALLGVVLEQMFLSYAVYGALLVGLFVLLGVADSVVALMKPILLLWSRHDAWSSTVEVLNFGLLAGLFLVAYASLGVLLGVVGRALRVLWRTALPRGGEISASDATWGSVWFLVGLITGTLSLLGIYTLGRGIGAAIGTLLFGSISVYAFSKCRTHWRAAAQAETQRRGWLVLPVVAAVLTAGTLGGGLLLYLANPLPPAAGFAPELGVWHTVAVSVIAIAWFAWLVPRAIFSIKRIVKTPEPLDESSEYLRGLNAQRRIGQRVLWIGAWFTLGSLPWATTLLSQLFDDHTTHLYLMLAALVLGVVVVAVRIASPPAARDIASAPARPSSFPALFAALVLYGTLVLAHGLTKTLLNSDMPGLALWMAGAGLLVGLLSQLNFAGPGRIYRDRLAEAFLPSSRAIRDNHWMPAMEAATFPLAKLASVEDRGPYHLLNASIATSGSANSKYHHRGTDNFILSPLFCGSAATGWCRTDQWMRGGLTLRDAIGISAAAIAPGAGLNGYSGARGKMISAMLALLNLRLGYWAHNPDPSRGPRLARLQPNLLAPGLRQGVFSAGTAETARHVQLSDGGHFDNLGLYELLRRELDLIVVADTSHDPGFGYRSLGLSLERAGEDLGVEVEFEPGAFDPTEASARGPTGETLETHGMSGRVQTTSRRGYAIGSIYYRDREQPGTLLYVKPTLVDDVDVIVRSFASVAPDFPHESTVDQSFNEDQFLAYEQLGYQIGLDALDEHLSIEAGAVESVRPPRRDSMFRLKGDRPSRVGVA